MVLATATAGCIIPQDDYVLQDVQRRRNRPPRIIPETVSPPGPTVRVGSDPLCGTYTFGAAVEDPDVDDTIQWAFFIDFETNPRKEVDSFILPSAQVVRPETARASFNPAQGSQILFSPGTHILELVVADTRFDNERVQAPHGETADGGIDPGFSDSYTWVVEVLTGGECN